MFGFFTRTKRTPSTSDSAFAIHDETTKQMATARGKISAIRAADQQLTEELAQLTLDASTVQENAIKTLAAAHEVHDILG
jgi:hypothetical protein